MSENLFDNFLKEKMQNHASPVAEGMWERIQVAREKNRRGAYWWKNYRGMGLGIAGLVLFSALMLSRQSGNKKICFFVYTNLDEIHTILPKRVV